MDIKLIVFIIIVFVILYWELTNIKKEIIGNHEKITQIINNQITEIIQNMDSNVEEICQKTKQYTEDCFKNIKNSNNENINQLKKINILNQQPITKIYNHFAENDVLLRSDENESNLYENNVQINAKKNDTICYLSDDITEHSKKMNKNVNKSNEICSKNLKDSPVKESDNLCQRTLGLNVCDNIYQKNNISAKENTSEQNSLLINIQENTCLQKNKNYSKKTKQNNSPAESDDKIFLDNNCEPKLISDKKVDKKKESSCSSSEINNKKKKEDKNEQQNMESPMLYPIKIDESLFPQCDNMMENITCSITMISNIPADVIAEFKYNPIVDKSISSELDMYNNGDSSNSEKYDNKLLNKISNCDENSSSQENLIDILEKNNEINMEKKIADLCDISSGILLEENVEDPQHSPPTMLSEIKNISEDTKTNENIFIQHNEKDKMNIADILQKIPTCSYNDLKNIAKKFSLPVTQKIGNRWIIYKKTELCDVLKDHIITLQKQVD